MGGDNGKMQEPRQAPKLKPIIVIGIDDKGEMVMIAPLHKKQYTLNLLAETIKFVANADVPQEQPSNIVVPHPGIRVTPQ